MWIDAGFEPDAFWLQSPATFQLAMQGVRKRMKRDHDAAMSLAWHSAAFGAQAQAGKLKRLDHYTGRQQRQTPQQMLAVMRDLQSRGAKMKITKVAR